MPLFLRGPSEDALNFRLTCEWHALSLPGAAGARLRLLDALGDAALLENTGDAALLVEAEQGTGDYVLTSFLAQGETGVIGDGSRLFVEGQQAATLHHITAMEDAAAVAAAGPEEGSSKRPLPGSPAEPKPGGGKRARHAGGAEAGRSGIATGADAASAAAAGSDDPLDRVPDAPMHLMRVRGIPSWANEGFLGVTLSDLVRGPMRWALASNYMMDLGWLLSACPDLAHVPRMVLVHGEHAGGFPALKLAKDIKAAGLGGRCILHAPPLPIQFGTHHSKFFLLEYERGCRVIIFTANAIYPDCNNKSQGLWWQDFPPKDEQAPKTSPFEQELAAYMAELKLPPSAGAAVRALLAGHDFSAARGHIIGSVPGYHTGPALHKWGHLRLRATLNREPPWPAAFRAAPLVAQYSSLGSLDEAWLSVEFRASLAAGRCGEGGSERLGMPASGHAGLQLVWPTVDEVQNSLEGWAAGRSIPGPAKNVQKPFLQPYYRRWGGEECGRQRAMPHVKSYLRYRSAGEGQAAEVAWLLVGSHNLSKAAWGALQKQGSQFMVRSYELSVLLTPATEAAYRSSRWHGFSCTSGQALPSAQHAGAAGSTAADAVAAAGANAKTEAAGQAAGPGAPPGPAAVRFVQWRRGEPQEAAVVPAAVGDAARQAGDDSTGAAAEGALHVPLPIPYRLPPERYSAGAKAWAVDSDWPGVDSLGRTRDNPFGAFYGLLEQMEWADAEPR